MDLLSLRQIRTRIRVMRGGRWGAWGAMITLLLSIVLPVLAQGSEPVSAQLAAQLSAQVFSPGELSKAHAKFDGLGSCKQCHAEQQKLERGKCLACHELIEKRQRTRSGFHGQGEVRGQSCESCHTEHKGAGASIISWPGGRPERFSHGQSGWPLKGEHAKVKCEDCHALSRVEDNAVVNYMKSQHKSVTWLGQDTDCDSCHFDEHRGTLEGTCDSCHTEKGWKPAPGFQHEKAWKLEGAHKKVDCKKCHDPLTDATYSPNAYPKPRAATYLKMSGIEADQCTDCHTDPHKSRFGADCRSCHTADDWTVRSKTGSAKSVAFHDKTAFPLEGKHQGVSCDTCHPRQKSGTRLLKPIAHDQCSSCHPTAHPELKGGEAKDCDACHTLEGFIPTTFTLEAHEKTRYPLLESHLAVSCVSCHDAAQAGQTQTGQTQAGQARTGKTLGPARSRSKPQKVRTHLAQQVLSTWILRADASLERCESCHTSPHQDQFQDKRCESCHTLATWKAATSFDHAKTDYPLAGKHAEVACGLCHLEEKGSVVKYRPIPHDDCATCHGDVHYGQFAKLEPKMACAQCHTTSDFKTHTFNHDAPAFSDFPLEGKHALKPCEGCHPAIRLATDIPVKRFRPTPQACEQCHLDPHDGAFQEAARLVRPAAGEGAGLTSVAGAETKVAVAALPSAWTSGDKGDKSTACDVCHGVKGWTEIRFDHAATGYPLKGQHARARCQDCHSPGRTGLEPSQKVPTDCASCHDNVHRGELGYTCQECHSEVSFRQPILPVARHARSSFPLLGRHAVTACRECHQDTRQQGFNQAPGDCFSCHEKALATVGAGAIDHSSFSSRCEQCHTPLSWRAANYREHDRCFPITPGSEHGGMACSTCHTGGIPAVTGTCAESGVSCVSCHGCEEREHGGVRGYECEDRKCYQCHPGGSG